MEMRERATLCSMISILSMSGRDSGRWGVRLVAITLLALIGGDLADVSCDPIGINPQGVSLAHAASPVSESCGEVCFPDCFCCARTLPAQSAFVIWRAEVLLEPPQLPVCHSVAGVSFILDHVPISLP
jgi:hypothetical protein